MSAVPDTDRRVETLRVPPQSTEAEQAVLGALMLQPESLSKVADWLAEDDFYRRDHRLFYRAIRELAEQNKPRDFVTIGEWFEAQGLTEQVGGAGYLVELLNATPSAANIVGWAEIVVECARKRQVIELGTKLVNLGFERAATSAQIAGEAQAGLAQLAPVRHTGLVEAKAGLLRWWRDLEARVDLPGLVGLPTPWSGLNKQTHGLRPGRLYILAGRPSMGKSIIGGQLSAFTALRGTRVALFSLEMSAEEIHQRNVAALAEVPHDFLEAPTSESDYWGRLNAAIAELRTAPLLVDDTPGLNAAQIVARAERAHLQEGLGLIVIDHLHEMAVDPKDRVNALGDAARRLKALGKRLGVPVVLLAQLNRQAAGRTDKRPDLSDLRASGAIEEVADAVIFVHREDYYHDATHLKGVVELILAKGRNVRVGTTYLRNRYDVMRADDWEGPLPEAAQPESKPKSRGYDARARAAGDH